MKRVLLSLIALTLLLTPAILLANDFGLDATAGAANLDDYGGDLTVLIGQVVGAFLSLIGIIFFVLVVYGGLMWMTAQGNKDTVKKAINTVISAAVGLIVVLAAYAITNFVLESVQGAGGDPTGPTATGALLGEACTADTDCVPGQSLACITDMCLVESGGSPCFTDSDCGASGETCLADASCGVATP